MKTIKITLYKELVVNVSGYYHKGDSSVGLPLDFEIDEIDLIEGTLLEYSLWVASNGLDWENILVEKALEIIENEI